MLRRVHTDTEYLAELQFGDLIMFRWGAEGPRQSIDVRIAPSTLQHETPEEYYSHWFAGGFGSNNSVSINHVFMYMGGYVGSDLTIIKLLSPDHGTVFMSLGSFFPEKVDESHGT